MGGSGLDLVHREESWEMDWSQGNSYVVTRTEQRVCACMYCAYACIHSHTQSPGRDRLTKSSSDGSCFLVMS